MIILAIPLLIFLWYITGLFFGLYVGKYGFYVSGAIILLSGVIVPAIAWLKRRSDNKAIYDYFNQNAVKQFEMLGENDIKVLKFFGKDPALFSATDAKIFVNGIMSDPDLREKWEKRQEI